MKIVYENKWCKIVSKDTIYVLKSKSHKYNDQYFMSLDKALRSIGINPDVRYSFQKDWSKNV